MSGLGPLSEVVCVQGDAFVISGHNGNLVPGGAHGVYVRDTRFLNRLQLEVDGQPPVHLAGSSMGGDRAVFDAYLGTSPDAEVDPTVLITRRRIVAGGLREVLEVCNAGGHAISPRISMRVGCDFAYIFDVKHGRVLDPLEPEPDGEVIRFHRPGGDERTEVRLAGGSGHDDRLEVVLHVPPGERRDVVLEVAIRDRHGGSVPGPDAARRLRSPPPGVPGSGDASQRSVAGARRPDGPSVRASDVRLTRLVRRSIADLRSLELRDPESPEDRYVAAGSPWFLTLFGRDSLWAAFMALPYDLDLARGTLRVLARRQGTRVDDETEEEPGKILHELRRGPLSDRGDLPSCYYGTVDATALFVVLAHEAWRWGLPDAEISSLLPHVEAALTWMAEHGDPGDGFVKYAPRGRRTLTNQGWKDSGDGVRYRDGTIAEPPLALCEVQGYAYDAAMRGAELLERFGGPAGGSADGAGERWRRWADGLRRRFAESFWVSDEQGPYPAVALDGAGMPVDGIASNMGHLLATGILDDEGTRAVAQRLSGPDLAPGWGLRTLSSRSGGYNPLSYHCGTIWPHDTAIATWGLARTRHGWEAGLLLRGLVRAAPGFHHRLPELFAGLSTEHAPHPVPYPAACRPQAWAAAGTLLLVRALLGIEADVPRGRVTVRPLSPPPFDRFELRDLPLAGGTVDLRLRRGRVEVDVRDAEVDVLVEHP